MRRCHVPVYLLLALSLSGCAGNAKVRTENGGSGSKSGEPFPSTSAEARPAAPVSARLPIWRISQTPTPLAPLAMVPGEKKRVSLIGTAGPDSFTIQRARTSTDIGASIILEPDAIVVQAEPGSDGNALVLVDVATSRGDLKTLTFPLAIEPLPIVEFMYTPPAGKEVQQVSVAGSFNGWSAGADPLEKGADGIFRLSKPTGPGTYTYKFVVDGDWIADPTNPLQDSSGFGNSLLEVAGDAAQKFTFAFLGEQMPGSGAQGGFKAAIPAGERLDPATVSIIVNNERRSASDWSHDPQSQSIKLSIPAKEWLKENFVTVVAQTTSGRRGIAIAQVAYADAPRSPRDEVIYFPMTDRFLNGDPSNDPNIQDERVHPLANYHGGDWAGIRQKIKEGYFKKLGVTTLWIAPVNENTMKVEQESVEPGRYYTSYHGYWPTSEKRTNPAFGTMDELQALVQEAHAHGIAILLDFVSNHFHEDHDLYKANPNVASSLKLPDGKNNIREFDARPLDTWFDTFMPDIDYINNPQMIPTMTDSAVYWLRSTNADGFRHDAVKHVPDAFWQELTRKLRREFTALERREVYQVGETISGHGTVARYVSPDMLNGQFDFPTYFAVQTVLARGEGSMSDLGRAVRDAQAYYPPSGIMSPLLGNHDVARFMGYADGDIPDGAKPTELGFTNPPSVDSSESYEKLQLGFAYLTAIPGPPTIYYGDEIGMTGAGDPDNRRPMIWENWTKEQQHTFDRVAELNKARRSSVALRRGNPEIIHESKECLVLARVAPEETVLIVLNRRPEAVSFTIDLPAHWGRVAGVVPVLEEQDVVANVLNGKLTIRGGNYSYGFYRVRW